MHSHQLRRRLAVHRRARAVAPVTGLVVARENIDDHRQTSLKRAGAVMMTIGHVRHCDNNRVVMVGKVFADQKTCDPLTHPLRRQHRIALAQLPGRIRSRRANDPAGKLHRLLGDRLRLAQVRQLLRRLGASIQNNQLRIVLNLNSGVAKMRGEDHRQRTIRTHPVNAGAAKALGAGLGKRSVAVTG